MTRMILFLGCCVAAGCGKSSTAPPATIAQYVIVVDPTGSRRAIPVGELFDPATRKPQAARVLAIDRQTGRRDWIDVREMGREPPWKARYLPVTQTEPSIPVD